MDEEEVEEVSLPIDYVSAEGWAEQDGTPTPANPIEIHVGKGRNLLVSDNSYWRTGSLTDGIYSNGVQVCPTNGPDGDDYKIRVEPNTLYAVLIESDLEDYPDVYVGVHHLDSELAFLRDSGWQKATTLYTFTTLEDARYVRLTFRTDPYNISTSSVIAESVGDAVRIMFCIYETGLAYYVPYGSIGLEVYDAQDAYVSVTPIDLQGNELASLPDGTHDELTIDSEGQVTLEKNVGVTDQATTDGIVATVGTDSWSTTGDLGDGATVYYPLAESQTIDLGTIELPLVPEGGSVTIPELANVHVDLLETIDDYGDDDPEALNYEDDDIAEEDLQAFIDEILDDPEIPQELADDVAESAELEEEAAAANIITNDEIEAMTDYSQTDEEVAAGNPPLFDIPADDLAELMASVEDSVDEGYDVSYEPVSAGLAENPSENGWYEFSNHVYTLTQDTEVDIGKVYYALVYVAVDPGVDDHPSEEGWYVMTEDTSFVLTDDYTVDPEVTYYRYNGEVFEPSPDPQWYDPADDTNLDDDEFDAG